MSELNFFNADVDFEPLGKHPESSIRHVVMTHVKDFKISLGDKALLKRLYLCVRKLVAHKDELAYWDNHKKC